MTWIAYGLIEPQGELARTHNGMMTTISMIHRMSIIFAGSSRQAAAVSTGF
jgi:hypothetical protein